jgi:hypothetical protein
MSATVVYVIVDADLCKIGVSREPEKRARVLGRKLGRRFLLWGFVPVSGEGIPRQTSFIVERLTHHRMKAARVRGEWFRVSPEEALRVIGEECDSVLSELRRRASTGEISQRIDKEVSDRRLGR